MPTSLDRPPEKVRNDSNEDVSIWACGASLNIENKLSSREVAADANDQPNVEPKSRPLESSGTNDKKWALEKWDQP